MASTRVQLSRRQQELARLLEDISAPMQWLDAGGRILWANQAQLELLGYRREEYVGRRIAEFDAGEEGGLWQHLPTNGARHRRAARLRCKDGSIKSVLIDSRTLSEDGAFSYAHCVIQNVGDRAGADKALRHSEAKLATVLANAADAIITIDENGTIQSFNPAASRIFGYGEAEVIGKDVAMLMPSPDSERHHGYLRRYLETGEKTIIGIGREVVGLRKDGGLLDLDLSISEISGGDAGMFMGIVRDITDRKRVERELRENQQRLSMAMTAGRMGTWEWNVASGEVVWSPTLEAIHGLAPGRFGGTFEDFLRDVHPEDRQMVTDRIGKSLQESEHEIEYRILRPDGEMRWLSARGHVVRDESGRPVRMMGICMDISDRKRAEQDQRFLAEATSKLAAAQLDLPMTLASVAHLAVPHLGDWCGIDILEEDGTLNRMAVVHQDPSKVEMAQGLLARYAFNPDDPYGVARVLRTGESEVFPEVTDRQIQELVKDEELAEIIRGLGLRSVMFVPLAARGRILGAITLAVAESERRYSTADLTVAEELARRAAHAVDNARLYAQLQKAIEAKDEFLGLVSHELRTPITAIYGGARMLKYRAQRLDDERRSGILTDIEEESERLYRIVENLLALARLELGQRIATEPVMLQYVVAKLVSSLGQRRPGRRIQVHLDRSLPPVAARPVYLEQILRNLLSNADKYSPAESQITVRGRQVDGEAQVSILDRGPGIEPEETDLIFERFFRAGRTAGRATGMGLGLTACKRMIEAQSGRIWARPRRGGGLEIGFALPLYREDAPQ